MKRARFRFDPYPTYQRCIAVRLSSSLMDDWGLDDFYGSFPAVPGWIV
jgi:hypothetical protein